jgi:hypothetical protein
MDVESDYHACVLISFASDKTTLEDTERSLNRLIRLAANAECVSSLIDGLSYYIRIVLTLTDNTECPGVEKCITELFNQIIQVIVLLHYISRFMYSLRAKWLKYRLDLYLYTDQTTHLIKTLLLAFPR